MKHFKEFFRWSSWLTLILTGLVCIIFALIEETIGAAIATAIVSAVIWAGWGAFLFYLFGVRRRMKAHLGYSPKHATFVDKEIGATRLNDVRQALESLFDDKAAKTARYGIKLAYPQNSLVFLQEGNTEVTTLQWTTVETQSGDFVHYPTNAVYFLWCGDIPFVACVYSQQDVTHGWEEEEYEGVMTKRGERLQVFARNLDEAARVLNFVLQEASVQSIYRGKMLHVAPRGTGLAGHIVRVTDLPDTQRERIVLPTEIVDVVHRAVLARLQHARLLEHHGHHSKTAILLHGAPGTGKTLITKYLLNLCRNHTAIVPAGMDSETIRECFRLAVYLQPAILVIEDVDLLAERRETNANVTGLQELMNELDGMAPSTDAIVLMSTNRPEIIEPALASRPGRVSQAVEFPLPDPELRKSLLQLFCRSAETDSLNWDLWVERSKNASPAFLEEWVRRAIIIAAERLKATPETTVTLIDGDFDQAMHELVVFGGPVTQNVLGL